MQLMKHLLVKRLRDSEPCRTLAVQITSRRVAQLDRRRHHVVGELGSVTELLQDILFVSRHDIRRPTNASRSSTDTLYFETAFGLLGFALFLSVKHEVCTSLCSLNTTWR